MAGKWNHLKCSSLTYVKPGLFRLSTGVLNMAFSVGRASFQHGSLGIVRFLTSWLRTPRTSIFSKQGRSSTIFYDLASEVT